MSKAESPTIVELGLDYTIKLPDALANQFHPADRFVLLPQGDMLILKRVNVLRISELVATATEENPPLSMEELDEIVHDVRKTRTQN